MLEKKYNLNKEIYLLKLKKKLINNLMNLESNNSYTTNFCYENNQDYYNIYIHNKLQNILYKKNNENKIEDIFESNFSNYSNNYAFFPNKFFDKIFNNEIKIQKNNKMVYMNSHPIKCNKTKRKKLNVKRKRSSKYRGVSKNGNKWQALLMDNRNKTYIGTYNSEEFAARIYDFMSIKKKGINAITNFYYNNRQIRNIILKDIDFKSKGLDKCINQLLNEN